jgi:hypothetical protein
MMRRALLALAALTVVAAGYFAGRELVRPPAPPGAAAPAPAAAEMAIPAPAASAPELSGVGVQGQGEPSAEQGPRRARRGERRERLEEGGFASPRRERPEAFAGRRPQGSARANGFERPARQGGAVLALDQAIRERVSGAWVEGEGTVQRVLRDDLRGRQHQRFVIALASGGTLLVAHNTRLAGRAPVAVGETVRFHGRYEWNARGGVVHWTHRDPRGRAGGWLELAGQRYE